MKTLLTRRIFLRRVLPLLFAFVTLTAQAQEITPAGKKLAALLDTMDVEHLWFAHNYVAWRTGKPTEKPVNDKKAHTHCSAFAVAVGTKLDVYVLRPPQHSANLLANAQSDWLQSDKGKSRGWQLVSTMTDAQKRANAGEFFVAVFKSSDAAKSGHIAIVRPAEKSNEAIKAEGPQIIQAGMENFASTTLKEGFKHHKGAFRDGAIKFFAHKIDWDKVEEKSTETKKEDAKP